MVLIRPIKFDINHRTVVGRLSTRHTHFRIQTLILNSTLIQWNLLSLRLKTPIYGRLNCPARHRWVSTRARVLLMVESVRVVRALGASEMKVISTQAVSIVRIWVMPQKLQHYQSIYILLYNACIHCFTLKLLWNWVTQTMLSFIFSKMVSLISGLERWTMAPRTSTRLTNALEPWVLYSFWKYRHNVKWSTFVELLCKVWRKF